MWLCVKCKEKFQLRSLLLLHRSKDCLPSEETTNHHLQAINNLAVQDDAGVYDEDPFHKSDDEDADPSYDPFADVNDKKRKYESDSTGSDDDVLDIDGDADIPIKVMTHKKQTKPQQLYESDFSGCADKDDHIEVGDNKIAGDNNNNIDDLLTSANSCCLVPAKAAEGLPEATISRKKTAKRVKISRGRNEKEGARLVIQESERFSLLAIALCFCGLATATNDFPDFLLDKEKTYNEIETPVGHLLTAPMDLGDIPCQMDVKIIERVTGKCERRGGSEACIAGSYVIPYHHDCIMNR